MCVCLYLCCSPGCVPVLCPIWHFFKPHVTRYFIPRINPIMAVTLIFHPVTSYVMGILKGSYTHTYTHTWWKGKGLVWPIAYIRYAWLVLGVIEVHAIHHLHISVLGLKYHNRNGIIGEKTWYSKNVWCLWGLKRNSTLIEIIKNEIQWGRKCWHSTAIIKVKCSKLSNFQNKKKCF